MNILVTGGAGFIGSHLTTTLACRLGGRVTVFDNLQRGSLSNLELVKSSVRVMACDVRNRPALQEAMRNTSIVFHLAAQASVINASADLDASFGANVVGTFNVLQTALEAGVQRVVFTSSREVYGERSEMPTAESSPLNPKNAYGVSKAAGEMYCRVYQTLGLEVAILRLANVYGPFDRGRVIPNFTENALRDAPLIVYGGRQVFDLIWVDNVVEALLRVGLGEYCSQPINIGSGKGTRILDLAHAVIAYSESLSTVQVVPARSIEVERYVADVSRARTALAWKAPAEPLMHLQQLIDMRRREIEPANLVQTE